MRELAPLLNRLDQDALSRTSADLAIFFEREKSAAELAGQLADWRRGRLITPMRRGLGFRFHASRLARLAAAACGLSSLRLAGVIWDGMGVRFIPFSRISTTQVLESQYLQFWMLQGIRAPQFGQTA
jgi:hypothetical protein